MIRVDPWLLIAADYLPATAHEPTGQGGVGDGDGYGWGYGDGFGWDDGNGASPTLTLSPPRGLP